MGEIPYVPSSPFSNIGALNPAAAGSSNLAALQVPSGTAVWVVISENTSPTKVTGVSDSAGNTYVQKKTLTETGEGTVDLWVADGVRGAAALTVTITVSAAVRMEIAVVVFQNQGLSSADAVSAGTSGTYTSTTSESASVTPTSSLDLLVFLLAILTTSTSGTPTIVYAAVAGEAVIQSGQNGTTDLTTGLGVYSKASASLAAQTVSGSATITGTGAASHFTAFGCGVLPSTGAGLFPLLRVGIILRGVLDSVRRLLGLPVPWRGARVLLVSRQRLVFESPPEPRLE